MPGIVGVIGRRSKGENDRDVEAMLASMKHEASYSVARFSDEELGVAAASLAHKGSFADLTSESNRRGE